MSAACNCGLDGASKRQATGAALTERAGPGAASGRRPRLLDQGAPRSGAPFAVEAGEGGRAAVLRQDGWTIVYQAYAPDAGAILRPARLTLSYPEVELRLAVDSWR
jgi:hypothetical protein